MVPRPIGIPSRRQTDTIEKALGATITELRIKKGISQAALAGELGYSISYISKLERGLMNPTLRTLFDLADSLETEPDLLVKRIKRSLNKARSRSRKSTLAFC
jgi:transcriptional regulator with XRE-family HTH domain